MNEILRAALHFSQLGLAVHWLCPPHHPDPMTRGKAPLLGKGWQLLPVVTAAELRATYRPGLNLGLRTGRVANARFHLVAVDCDSLEAARWCVKNLPLTPLRTMSRNGWHLFYRRPVTIERVPNRLKVARLALDVRADEGNIVLPPSVHPTGFVYTARAPWTLDCLEVLPVYDPGWMPGPPEAVPAPMRASASLREGEHARLDAARAALRKLRPCTSDDDGGESRLWTAALTLACRFQLDQMQIAALLMSDFLPRGTKQWPEWRVIRKAAEAVRSRAAVAARGGPRP